jgi:hypothetical protein
MYVMSELVLTAVLPEPDEVVAAEADESCEVDSLAVLLVLPAVAEDDPLALEDHASAGGGGGVSQYEVCAVHRLREREREREQGERTYCSRSARP